MTVIWIDGFDMYNGAGANTGLLGRWNSTFAGTGSSVSITSGRFGGQAFRATGAANITNAANGARAIFDGVGSHTSISVGFAHRLGTLTMTSRTFELANTSLTSQCGMGITVAGAPYVYTGAGGSTLATGSAGLVLINAWNYFELEIVLGSTTGSISLYMNGSLVCSATNVNTFAAGTGGYNAFAAIGMQTVTGGVGTNYDFDDIYVNDTSTRLGERRIETLRPSADSSVVFTPNSGGTNFSRVNETTVDGDTSYVSSSNVGDRDLYAIGSLSTTPTTIDAISVVSFSEKTDATTRAIYHSVQSNGTDSDGSSISLNATYQRYDRLMTTDPHTSAAWTASGVNNLLIGPKVAV
jgi:hypothetical protein